jgi:hypothetical protein
MDFAAQRAETEKKLAKLRRQRGQANLDGVLYDNAEIEALETALASLNDTEGAAAARHRQDEADRVLAIRTDLCSRLLKLENHRLDAVGRAEAAAREMTDAMADVQSTASDMRRLVSQMSARCPPVLTELEHRRRLGERLATLLPQASGRPREFGTVGWGQPLFAKVDDDWAAKERDLLSPAINLITEKDDTDVDSRKDETAAA